MSATLDDLLPLAVAIAASPVPILAVVLMLMSEHGRGRVNALALLAGWAVTLVLAVSAVAAFGIGGAADDDAGHGRGVAIGQLALAAILLVVIAVEWRGRRRRGRAAPRWMAVLVDLGPGRALALGVGLVAFNVKDAALTLAAGARLAEASPSGGAAALRVAVFALVASATLILPIAVDLVLGERAAPVLRRWHDGLARHGSTVVIATLGAVVAALVVQGAGQL